MKRKALHCKKGLPKVPGKPRGTDQVPAWLTPGEAVLNPGAAEMLGRDRIELLNQMGMRLGSNPTPSPQALAHGTARVQPVYAASGWVENSRHSLWREATSKPGGPMAGRFYFPSFGPSAQPRSGPLEPWTRPDSSITRPEPWLSQPWAKEPMDEPFGGGREPMPGYFARGTDEVFPRLYDPARLPRAAEPLAMTMGEKMAPFANQAPPGMTDMTRGLREARLQYPGATQFAEPSRALTPVPGTRFTQPGPPLQAGQGIRVTDFDNPVRDPLGKGPVRIPAEAMPMAGRAGLENRITANRQASFGEAPAGSMPPLARRASAVNEALPGGVLQTSAPTSAPGMPTAGAATPASALRAANPYNPNVGDLMQSGLQRTGQAVGKAMPALETAGRWLGKAGKAAGYLGAAQEAGQLFDVATDPNKTGADKLTQGASTLARLGSAGAGAIAGATAGAATGPLAPVAVPVGAMLGGWAGYQGADAAIRGGRQAMGASPDDPAASSRGALTRVKDMVTGQPASPPAAPSAGVAASPGGAVPTLGGRVFTSPEARANAARGMIAEGVSGAPRPADYYQPGLSRTPLGNGLERVAVQPSQAMLDAGEDMGRGYGRSPQELQRIGWGPAPTPVLGKPERDMLAYNQRMAAAPARGAPTEQRPAAMLQSFEQAAREIPQLVYLATKATDPDIREGAQRALQSLSSLAPGLGAQVMEGYATDQNAGVRRGQQAYYAGAGEHYQSEAEKNRDMIQRPEAYLGSRKGAADPDKRSFQLIPNPEGGDAAPQMPVMVGQDGSAIPVRVQGAAGTPSAGPADFQASYQQYLALTQGQEQMSFPEYVRRMTLRQQAGAS